MFYSKKEMTKYRLEKFFNGLACAVAVVAFALALVYILFFI